MVMAAACSVAAQAAQAAQHAGCRPSSSRSIGRPTPQQLRVPASGSATPAAAGSSGPASSAPRAAARARLHPRRAASAPAVLAAVAAASGDAQVVLTREQGKNGKLRRVLEGRGIACLELPMVETAAGPDRHLLPKVLAEQAAHFDWVCITSPEAASVFLEGWRAAGRPPVRLAVVGEGTGRVFEAAAADGAPQPEFVPSVANAEHFGPELPFLEGGTKRVLYPASNKASSELQSGLAARGFDVVRLNTYDTVPVTRLDERQLAAARRAAVVTVGSPSAIKAWVQIVGEEATHGMSIACIGSTSARAAEKLGLQAVKYPEQPGVDTWAAVVEDCLRERQLLPAA
ncbi:hypothetical protein CHLNCDRAFT_34953 [Chlorella variabilis]|uniref:Uroporphyrinogen-III synthase n=1 Tax=Chlorella variabilis TaxID=554065 RepID=E1ZBX0_CHLVA|nr:hypothetical protein CHLNCDRAFT_34953 [Chlorella variabilis]EFN56503.1 hypothetical protein CHLNCDRAFT_34953 [Chlorella variabilis]|eukprot:XP_005848605.1 hypothetical protein CHLNCDRAFT_34953 [Chlorella variabilis]